MDPSEDESDESDDDDSVAEEEEKADAKEVKENAAMWKPFLIEKYFSGEVDPSSEDIMAKYDWFKLQYKKGISNMLDYTLAHPNVNASESVRAYKMIEDAKAERKAMPTQGEMLKKIIESDPNGLTEERRAIAEAFQAFGQALHKNEFGKQPFAFKEAVKLALDNQKK